MTIIEIAPLPNGAHRNQTVDLISIPEGWAEVPSELMDVWNESGPFVDIEVNETGAITAMTPGARPEPEPEPETFNPLADLDALAIDHEYRLTLLELEVI